MHKNIKQLEINNKRWRKKHKQHTRYLTHRTMARTFVRKYARSNDIKDLLNIWDNRHSNSVNNSISNYIFYHGTVLKYARQIQKNGFKISNHIGSLGRGAYAFCESKGGAKHFAWRTFRYLQRKNNYHLDTKLYQPCLISFKLASTSYVLDFTNPITVNIFNEFTNTASRQIKFMTKQNSNLGKVKTLDGAVIDWLLKSLNKSHNKKYLGVYNPSQNEISKGIIPDSRIPNSIELCVKNNQIIDCNSIKVLLFY